MVPPMAPLLLLLLCLSSLSLILRPASAIDALFNEPGQFLLAPVSLGQFGFDLAKNCSIKYKPKNAAIIVPLHDGYKNVKGCQLLLDNNGTVGFFPEGEFERRRFDPRPTRSGYYVLASSNGHTIVNGPAIFCTPKDLCRPELPHAPKPGSGGGLRLRFDHDWGLGGAVMSGPGRLKPGVILSYGNYSLLLEKSCNLSIVDVTTNTATWTTNTTLPKPPDIVECSMLLTPKGELTLEAMHKDGRYHRVYGTNVIAGRYGDPGHIYALRYDGRLMIYPPKPWSPPLLE